MPTRRRPRARRRRLGATGDRARRTSRCAIAGPAAAAHASSTAGRDDGSPPPRAPRSPMSQLVRPVDADELDVRALGEARVASRRAGRARELVRARGRAGCTACGLPTETGVKLDGSPPEVERLGLRRPRPGRRRARPSAPSQRAATSRAPKRRRRPAAPGRSASQRAAIRAPLPENSAFEPSGFQISDLRLRLARSIDLEHAVRIRACGVAESPRDRGVERPRRAQPARRPGRSFRARAISRISSAMSPGGRSAANGNEVRDPPHPLALVGGVSARAERRSPRAPRARGSSATSRRPKIVARGRARSARASAAATSASTPRSHICGRPRVDAARQLLPRERRARRAASDGACPSPRAGRRPREATSRPRPARARGRRGGGRSGGRPRPPRGRARRAARARRSGPTRS